MPPLQIIARSIHKQLLANDASSESQDFILHCLSIESVPESSDKLWALLLSLLHDTLLRCHVPSPITYEQQIQLSHDVCHEDCCDVEFIHLVFHSACNILHTPIVLFTGHLKFPYVPFIPTELPFSGLSPIYIAVANIYSDAFWEVHSAASPIQLSDSLPDEKHIIHEPSIETSSMQPPELNDQELPIAQPSLTSYVTVDSLADHDTQILHSTIASIAVPLIEVADQTDSPIATCKEVEQRENAMTRSSESTECELLQPVTGQPVATNEHGAPISLQQQLPPAVESAELIPTFETSLPDNTMKYTCGHSSK